MKLNYVYIGESKGIFERSKLFCQKIKIYDEVAFYSDIKFDLEFIYSLSEDMSLILLDYPKGHGEFYACMEFLDTIRRTTQSKRYYICITSEDEKSVLSIAHYFRIGINSIYNKDGDLELFLYQLFYIANNDLYIPKYATTKKFYAKSEIKLPLFVEDISEQNATIASDYLLPQELSIENFLGNYNLNGVKNREQEFSQNSFVRYSSNYDLTFPNAWDNDKNNSYDTISTQLKNSLEGITSKRNILMISEYSKFLSICKNNKDFTKKCKVTCLEVDPENLFDKKIYGDYDLIVFDILGDITDDQRYDLIFEVASFNKSNNPEKLPYLVVLKSNSTTEALSKVLKYPNLIASQTLFNEEMIGKLINTFSKKEKKVVIDTYEIPYESPTSLNFIPHDIVVTALNEFRITFITEAEIPLYSFIQIDLGITLNILVVPPTMYMAKVGDKTHYMGFFFGMSEKTLQKLRILVNHFLNIRLEELDNTFFNLITDDMKKLEPPKEEPIALEEEAPKEEKQEIKKKASKEQELESNFKKGYYSKM